MSTVLSTTWCRQGSVHHGASQGQGKVNPILAGGSGGSVGR
jgi:hypothetical protein